MQSKVAALRNDMAAMQRAMKQLEVMVENSYKPRNMCYTFKELCMYAYEGYMDCQTTFVTVY